MLGLEKSEPAPAETTAEENVTVLVEAPVMETFEPEPPAGPTCSADLELQTADTQRLDEKVTTPADPSFADTVEVEPVVSPGASEEIQETETDQVSVDETIDQKVDAEIPEAPIRVTDEPLLDLEPQTIADEAVLNDVELDLDFQETAPNISSSFATHPGPQDSQRGEFSIALEKSEQPETSPETTQSSVRAEADALSTETIEAIAQRVVERMSDSVVREIAWEVVPELSELLIRKKLDEQN